MIAACQATDAATRLKPLCAVLAVSRSWYYARPKAQEPTEQEILLRDAIELIILEVPGSGYRMATRQLQIDGWQINHKRVLRIMREESLLCRLRKRFIATTDSDHAHRIYPNLIKGWSPVRCDQVWVADITYIRLPLGFCYLAVILDACSRRCIGWCLSDEIDSSLTLTALERAIARRSVPAGLIHHSDRGVQYANAAYIKRLQEIDALPSMSRIGNPYDNAKAESFFKTLKRQEVYLNDYRTLRDAEANLGRFIDDVYNIKRLHSSLGYLPPIEFEARQAAKIAMMPTGISF
jgi:transposase InsO family protein